MNAMSGDWYVHVEGSNPQGPMGTAQVRDGIASGRVPPHARVCRAGTTQWVPISSVPDFAAPAASPYGAPQPPSGMGAPPMSGDMWHVGSPGAPPQGPMTDQQIVQGIAQGMITPAASVCRTGGQQWIPITQLPQFAAHFPVGPMGGLPPVPAGGYGYGPHPMQPMATAGDAGAYQLLVDIYAGLALFSFVLPWAKLGKKMMFSWDVFDRSPPFEAVMLMIYPPIFGVLLLVLNRIKMPSLAKGLGWTVLALFPFAIWMTAGLGMGGGMSRVGATPWLIVIGQLLLAATLLARHLRPASAIFRWAPMIGALMVLAGYLVPFEGGALPIAGIFDGIDRGKGWMKLVAILALVPPVFAIVGIVFSCMSTAGGSRALGLLCLLYWPVIFFGVAIYAGLDEQREWWMFLHIAILLGAYLYTAAAGLAVAIAGIAPKAPQAASP